MKIFSLILILIGCILFGIKLTTLYLNGMFTVFYPNWVTLYPYGKYMDLSFTILGLGLYVISLKKPKIDR
ncbi:hypothetical protein SDC9_132658 [bioreactor metagenome]|uniref:Uncharacterized protein n=1 Tax=bioreactor metagenome TaxID=1076179 RepID=A0A645D8P5_9ZZZZ